MKPVSFSKEKDIFKNDFIRLYSVQAEFPGYNKEYFVTDKGSRVGVLLLKDSQVLLVRQYRFLINDYSWEIPGGGIQSGESPEQAARRECREEAGVVSRSLIQLFDYRVGIDAIDNRVHLFRGSKFSDLEGVGDGKETDAREWVPLKECLKRVMSGELKDLMTIVALLIHCNMET